LTCIQAIQDILAEACQVAALTLDPTGQPLTTLSNSSALCTLILASTEGRRRCAACWQGLAHGQAGRCPQPTLCHAGLSYLVVPVTTQGVGQRVATLAVGQIWTEPCTADLPALAQACALDLTAVQQAAAQMPCSSAEHLARVGRLAERTAAAFAEIGQERWRPLSRLQSIAEMTVVE
jgi:hypothetical protein